MVDSIEVARRPPFGDSPAVGPRGTRTQRRILRAALEVFAAHGYHDSSVEQITEAAGCSRPSFYQYFSSKQDVFRALAAHVGHAVVAMIDGLGPITADDAGRARLVAWMRDLARFYDEFTPVFIGFSAAARSDSGLADASGLVSADFGRALSPHLDLDGTATGPIDPEVMASMVMTMILRANLLRRGMTGLIARKRFTESLAALVHRALLGPAAAFDAGDGAGAGRQPAVTRLAGRPPRLDAVPTGAGRNLSPQGQRMRARIVDAATAVFPRRGYHETRIDDVVAAAGASHGSFYRYFGSKEDLFRALATEAAVQLLAGIEAFPAGGAPPTLRDWLEGWFDLYARHGGIIAIWRETPFPDRDLVDLSRRVAKGAMSGLLQALEGRTAGDELVTAMAFLGLIETVPHHVHALGYYSRGAAIDALVAIIRRGFLGLPAAD